MRLRQSKLWDELNQLKVVSVCAGAQADSVGSCAEAKATRPRGRNKLARERILNVVVCAIGKRIEMFRLISLVVQYSWLSRKVPTQVDIYTYVYSCSMNLARVAPSGCRQKKSTATCLAKEATSCEYGLGMRKCW